MPYNLPNETKEMTKDMESCVSQISGTNPRTKKPYTESEKIAICKVAIMKKHEKSESKKDRVDIDQYGKPLKKELSIKREGEIDETENADPYKMVVIETTEVNQKYKGIFT